MRRLGDVDERERAARRAQLQVLQRDGLVHGVRVDGQHLVAAELPRQRQGLVRGLVEDGDAAARAADADADGRGGVAEVDDRPLVAGDAKRRRECHREPEPAAQIPQAVFVLIQPGEEGVRAGEGQRHAHHVSRPRVEGARPLRESVVQVAFDPVGARGGRVGDLRGPQQRVHQAVERQEVFVQLLPRPAGDQERHGQRPHFQQRLQGRRAALEHGLRRVERGVRRALAVEADEHVWVRRRRGGQLDALPVWRSKHNAAHGSSSFPQYFSSVCAAPLVAARMAEGLGDEPPLKLFVW